MDDDVAIINDAPSSFPKPFFADREKPCFLFQLLLNGISERTHLRRAVSACNDKITADNRLIMHIKNNDIMRFLVRKRFCTGEREFMSFHEKPPFFTVLKLYLMYYVWHNTLQY